MRKGLAGILLLKPFFGDKKLKIPEKNLIAAIKSYLLLQARLGKLSFNRIHTMGIIYGNGPRQRIVPNKDMEGFSDFHILANGNAGYMEVKAIHGRISIAQEQFLIDKQSHGAKTGIVRSLNEAIQFVEQLINGEMSIVGIGSNKSGGTCKHGNIRRIPNAQGSVSFYQKKKRKW